MARMAAGLQISTATTGDDITALAHLRAAWITGEATSVEDDFTAHFHRWFEQERQHRVFWLARLDGRAVAMVNLSRFDRMPSPGREPSCWGYLGNMFVRPDAQKQGVGAALLAVALSWADEQGLVRVVLNPTEVSVPLYQSQGFRAENNLLVRTPPSD